MQYETEKAYYEFERVLGSKRVLNKSASGIIYPEKGRRSQLEMKSEIKYQSLKK